MVAKPVEKELPPLFKRHVRRPRLTRLLDASTAQAILLIAPAGYGKTTLAAEWLQGRDAGFWYRATTASADVAAFSAGVVEVIQPLMPGAGDRVLQRLRVPEVPERLARILAELLAEDIQRWPKDKWLVVDDYHLVAESAAVEEFVDWLLTLSPIRLILTSRIRPSWASARRTLYGEITEIAREQLAMTSAEADQVVSDTPGASARGLVDEAEGWPAIIGLAASGVSHGSGTHISESLYRFMAEELLRREDQESQEVLLRSAVPPRLNQAFAAAIDIDLRRFGDLFERQALIDEHNSDALTLHPLMRDFLHRELRARDPSGFIDYHRAALEVALEREWWHDAFELAQHVSGAAATDVIVRAAPAYFARGRLETIEKWLSAASPAVSRNPSALLVRADLLIRLDRLLPGHALAAEVASMVGEQHPSAARAWTLQGQASFWQANDARALAEQRRAIRIAADDDRRHALWYAYLSAVSLGRDDAYEFLVALDALNRHSPNAVDRLRIAVGQVVVKSREGTLSGCAEVLERASVALDDEADPLVVSSFLAHSSYVALSDAKYDRARALAREASRHARTLRLTLPLHASLGYEALSELGSRNPRTAARIHIEMKQLASGADDPNTALITAIVGLKIDLVQQRELRQRLEPPEVALLGQSSAVSEFDAIAAVAAAVLGEYDLAEEKLAVIGEARGLEPYMYGLVARLILADRRHDSETLALLYQTVREAERRASLDALVIAYRSRPEILAHVPALDAPKRAAVQRAIERSHDQKLAATYGLRLGISDPIDALLTPRELEVLRLMAEGLRNIDIAQTLVISHSTAKVHVHNVIHKLGAKSRLQAIRRFEAAELASPDES